jgi:hypothetical protein
VIEDTRAETIQELETLISDCSRSKISEYDLWTKADGKQEVKAYLKVIDNPRHFGGSRIKKYPVFLWFECEEMNGERRYGPANGAIWWQITVCQIGKGHVLVALIIFQDGSWVKMNLSCEPIFGSDLAQHSRECKVQERSFLLLECLPVYSAEAAANAGTSQTNIRIRTAEVHQACLGIVEAVRELNSPAAYRFANGQVLMGEVRLAFIMGNQPAQDKHIGKKSKSCRMCLCSCDKPDRTDETFPCFDWRECRRSLLCTADECLDDNGRVLYGKKKEIEGWEKKYGIHFITTACSTLQMTLDCSL